ncbi:2'-5' RNA ligase family protein [Rhodococcus sp. X156]|uniref:2'-5' RNA ligase family protein n=1 Tax=Rhodococcus sp. X156 TaxID=2499145 RepID=UPI000FDA662D|nr:2'-5' RNA ligase family protein [Rhodococcus sp. X156]
MAAPEERPPRSGVQTVELLLDAGLDDGVRQLWDRLIAAGQHSQGVRTDSSNRPHVTLAVARHLDSALEPAITAAVAAALPLPLTLGGLLVFPAGRATTLACAVVPSAALLALHAAVSAVVGVHLPHTAPGAWSPHVTLARRVRPEQLGPAVQVLGRAELAGTAAAARRWDGTARREWLLQEPCRPPA